MNQRYLDNSGMRAGTILAGLITFDIVAMIVAVVLGMHAGDPLEHLAEKKLISWISVIQLLAVSWAAYSVYKARCPKTSRFNWRKPYAIWAIIAFGFFFLAADELTMIHESIDNGIHYLFRLEETAVTDRIDDIIIGIYGLIGIGVLYYYREEIMKSMHLLPYLVGGFILLFTSVVFDVLTNRNDIIALIVPDEAIVSCHVWLAIVEETIELIAENIFLAGFLVTRGTLIAARAEVNYADKENINGIREPVSSPAARERYHTAP